MIDDSQPSAPEGVTDDSDEKDGGGASVVGLTDLNEQLKMSFAKLRRFVNIITMRMIMMMMMMAIWFFAGQKGITRVIWRHCPLRLSGCGNL